MIMEAACGVVAGRYELGELLGSGGMADVYAARDRVLDRDVAIKFFRPIEGRVGQARFVSEARLLAGLSHPGLVTVYDAYLADRRPCLIMRLVDNGTLRRRVDDGGPLPPREVATLGARVAAALAHVHARGIVHRDIKPSNVLIDSAGEHFLADFGLAWTAGSAQLTNSGEMVGTAYYLAPEQVRGDVVGPAADVYALGLVLLESLTGRTEYEGTNVEVALARLSRPPVVPGHLGPSWLRLITAMTDLVPANRPTAADCARRLRKLARSTPATAVAARPQTTELGRPARRPGRLHAGLGAAGAAAVALTAVMLPLSTSTTGEPVPGHETPTHRNAPAEANRPAPKHAAPRANADRPPPPGAIPAAMKGTPKKKVKPDHVGKDHPHPAGRGNAGPRR
jgi:serine/threonine protein kinase